MIPAAGYTRIEFTASGSTSDHGIDLASVGFGFNWTGTLSLRGPGDTATTGKALMNSGSICRNINGGKILIEEWGTPR